MTDSIFFTRSWSEEDVELEIVFTRYWSEEGIGLGITLTRYWSEEDVELEIVFLHSLLVRRRYRTRNFPHSLLVRGRYRTSHNKETLPHSLISINPQKCGETEGVFLNFCFKMYFFLIFIRFITLFFLSLIRKSLSIHFDVKV